jgi:hypothetical protein
MKNILKYYTRKNLIISMIIITATIVSIDNAYIRYLITGIYLTLNILFSLCYVAKRKPIGKKEIIAEFVTIGISIVGFIYIACKLT